MARAVKAVSTQRGRDVREFTLIAFGGSGPVHAVQLAHTMGIRRVVVPLVPGLFSAAGLLMTDIEHDFTQPTLRCGPTSTAQRCRRYFAGSRCRPKPRCGTRG